MYTEDEGDYSFDIRFAPIEKESADVVPTATSPSNTDSSPDALLVTPGTPITAQMPFEAGPMASPSWTSHHGASRVKGGEGGQEGAINEEPAPRKRARVAFA